MSDSCNRRLGPQVTGRIWFHKHPPNPRSNNRSPIVALNFRGFRSAHGWTISLVHHCCNNVHWMCFPILSLRLAMPKPPYKRMISKLRGTACVCVLRVSFFLCVCMSLLSCAPFRTVFNRNHSASLDYLKSEFEQIRALPESVAGPQQSVDKGQQGHIGTVYTSDKTSDEIKVHYEAELLKRGWKFFKIEKVIYNGRDYGGQHVFYCKNLYTADLQFAGAQQQQFGWTYSFSLSWGLYDTACP